MQRYAVIPVQKGTVEHPGAWAPVIVSRARRQSFQSSLGNEKGFPSRTGCTGSIPIRGNNTSHKRSLTIHTPVHIQCGPREECKNAQLLLELREHIVHPFPISEMYREAFITNNPGILLMLDAMPKWNTWACHDPLSSDRGGLIAFPGPLTHTVSPEHWSFISMNCSYKVLVNPS